MTESFYCPVLAEIRPKNPFARISFLTSVRNDGTIGKCIERCPVSRECGGGGSLKFRPEIARQIIFVPDEENNLIDLIKRRFS